MRNRVLIYPIFITFLCFVPLKAQSLRHDSPQKYLCQSPRDLVVRTWHDGWRIAAAPLKWRKPEWLKLSALVGVGSLMYTVETDINQYWHDYRSANLATAAKIFCEFGNEILLLPAFGTLYLSGYLGHKSRICQLGSSGLRSLVIVGILTGGLKFLAQREGPDNHDLWHGPVYPFEGESFPSGHTAMAFCAATVLAHELQFSPALKIVTYGLATGTAWSRIYDHHHWLTDVFAGAVIGHFTTKALVNFQKSAETSLRLEPFFSGKAAGIACRF